MPRTSSTSFSSQQTEQLLIGKCTNRTNFIPQLIASAIILPSTMMHKSRKTWEPSLSLEMWRNSFLCLNCKGWNFREILRKSCHRELFQIQWVHFSLETKISMALHCNALEGIRKSILEIIQRSGAQWCRKSVRGKYIDIYGAASPSLRCYPPHIWLWNLTHKFQIMKQGNGKSKKCFLSYLVYKYNTNHTLNT